MIASLYKFRPFILFLVLGLVASFLPLIGDFYLETAQIASILFSFYTIWKVGDTNITIDREQIHLASHRVLLGSTFFRMGIFLFPILIATLIRGCFNLDGLLFVLMIPSVGIVFVYSITLLVRVYTGHYKILTTLIVIFIGAILPLLILKNVPHVFLFNPIWGWFPGPIYDEQINMSLSLLYHSLFVLGLSFILLLVNKTLFRGQNLKRTGFLAINGTILILFLLNWSDLGLGYSLNTIENRLGGVAESDNFVLIYDEDVLTDNEVKYWLFWHEFHFSDLSQQLNINWEGERIRSVLYRDVWQKLEYTGAKYTSYVPVWNKIPQLHLDLQSADLLLRHEMVHVLAKEFSNSITGANLKIGLTEGIAVALEDPRSMRFTRDEILVNSDLEIKSSLIDGAFSFLGFYGGRSSINYSVSGSFVSYLLQNYDVEDFKCVYGGSDFDECFNSFVDIKDNWVEYIADLPPDTTATLYARNYINRESIFEKKCARFISDTEKQYDIYRMKYYRNDFEGAYSLLLQLYKGHPASSTIWLNLSELGVYLNESIPEFEFSSTHNLNDSINVFLRKADLAFIDDNYYLVNQYITNLDSINSPNPAVESYISSQLTIRGFNDDSPSIDEIYWENFIDIRYRRSDLPDNSPILHYNLWLTLNSNRNLKLHPDDVHKVFMTGISEMNESNLNYIMSNIIPLRNLIERESRLKEVGYLLEQKSHSSQSINVLNMYNKAINFSESYH